MRQIKWNNITIKQYFLLQKKLKGVQGFNRALMIACELHGLNIDEQKDKGVENLATLTNSISFFGTIPMDKPICTVKIGGKEVFFKPLASISSGEFIDIQGYEQDSNLDELDTVAWQIARLSATPILKALPKDESYKSLDIIKAQYNYVLAMNMQDFWGLYSFFLNKQKNSSKIIVLYLVNQLNVTTKNQLKRARLELTQLKHFYLSLRGWRLRTSVLYLSNYRKVLALRFLNLRLSLNNKDKTNEL